MTMRDSEICEELKEKLCLQVRDEALEEAATKINQLSISDIWLTLDGNEQLLRDEVLKLSIHEVLSLKSEGK